MSSAVLSPIAREFVDMTAEVVELEVSYVPMKKQEEFHDNEAKYRCYSGCWGGGKTKSGCEEAIKHSLAFAHNQGIILRQSYPELRDTTMATFFEEIVLYSGALGEAVGDREYGCSEGIPGFNGGKQAFRFTNGSIVFFRYAEGAGRMEAEHLKSFNLGWFYIDEAVDVGEAVFKQLIGRLRRPGVKRCGWMTTNPGGKGHWIYQKFFVSKDPEYFVVETNIYENHHLPEDYVKSLEKSLTPDERDRYLMGKWGKFEGQVYKWFDRDKHVVKEMKLGEGQVFVGVDHGYEDPAVFLPWHYDGDTLKLPEEFYESGKTTDELIEIAVEMEKRYPDAIFIADPSNPDMIERMRRKGLTVWPNKKKNIVEGISAVSGFKNKMEIHQSCVNTVNEFESYKWKKVGGEIRADIPEDKMNHAMDATRYVGVNLGKSGTRLVGTL